jgi:hypothetical protein
VALSWLKAGQPSPSQGVEDRPEICWLDSVSPLPTAIPPPFSWQNSDTQKTQISWDGSRPSPVPPLLLTVLCPVLSKPGLWSCPGQAEAPATRTAEAPPQHQLTAPVTWCRLGWGWPGRRLSGDLSPLLGSAPAQVWVARETQSPVVFQGVACRGSCESLGGACSAVTSPAFPAQRH